MLGFVACSSTKSPPAATPTPSPTGPLAGVVLTSAEMSSSGPAVTEILALNGQGLQDITLDLCGKNFPSDNKRADRLQVSYTDNANGRIAESNEIVKYEAGGAALAYTELTHTTCAKNISLPNGDILTEVTFTHGGAGLLAKSVIVSSTVKQRAGGSIGTVAVYQFDDDYLDAVYVTRANVDQASHDASAYALLAAAKLKTLAGD